MRLKKYFKLEKNRSFIYQNYKAKNVGFVKENHRCDEYHQLELQHVLLCRIKIRLKLIF